MATKPQNIGGLSQEQAGGIQDIYKANIAKGMTAAESKAALQASPAFAKAKAVYNTPAPTMSGSVTPIGMQKTEGAAPVVNNAPATFVPNAPENPQTNLEVQRNKEQAAFNAANPVGTKAENISYTAPSEIKPIASVEAPQAMSIPKTQEQAATAQKTPIQGVDDNATLKQNADNNRKREILTSLDDGFKNDPEINKAISTGDYETYKTRYEYDTADSAKRATLDAYFQAKQPKDSEGIYNILKTGARIASKAIMASPDYAKAKAKADMYTKFSGMTSGQLLTEMKNGNIGTDIARELAASPEYQAAKQQFEISRTTSEINKNTQDALNVIKNKAKTEENIVQKMSDKATAGVDANKLPSLQTFMKEQAPELVEKVASFNQKNQALRELSDERDNMLRTVIKDHPGISKGAAMVLASRNNESLNDQIKSMSYDLQTMQADINYATEIVKADFENTIKQQETAQAFSRQKELAQFQQDLQLSGNQAEFEQKIKQQAQLASDPYTAIQTVMNQYAKLGVPFTQSIATKVADANAFISAGGTIGGYVDKMIKDVQAKPEYKTAMSQKLGGITPYEQAQLNMQQKKLSFDMAKETQKKWTKLDDGMYQDQDGNVVTANEMKQNKVVENIASIPPGTYTGQECGTWARSKLGMTATPGGNSLDDRKKAFSSQDAQEGGMVLFSGGGYDKQYGHIAIVTGVNADGTINVKESNYNGDKKVTERRNVPTTYVQGYYNNTPLVSGATDVTEGFSQKAIDWGTNILNGSAKLSDITGKSNEQLKTEVSSYLANSYKTQQNTDVSALTKGVQLVKDLIDSPGRLLATGRTGSIPGGVLEMYDPNVATFNAKLDQLNASNFMEGIKSMKGFGALSDAEGKKVDASMSTLSKKNQDEKVYKQALDDLKEVFSNKLASIENKTGLKYDENGFAIQQQTQEQPSSQTSDSDPLGILK